MIHDIKQYKTWCTVQSDTTSWSGFHSCDDCDEQPYHQSCQMHCEQPEMTDNNGNEVTYLFIDLLNYFMHKKVHSTCYDTLHCKISRKKRDKVARRPERN